MNANQNRPADIIQVVKMHIEERAFSNCDQQDSYQRKSHRSKQFAGDYSYHRVTQSYHEPVHSLEAIPKYFESLNTLLQNTLMLQTLSKLYRGIGETWQPHIYVYILIMSVCEQKNVCRHVTRKLSVVWRIQAEIRTQRVSINSLNTRQQKKQIVINTLNINLQGIVFSNSYLLFNVWR